MNFEIDIYSILNIKDYFMEQRFDKHSHLSYFFLYAISFVAYGVHISGLGPFIPYLTA